MSTKKREPDTNAKPETTIGRREALKGFAAAAAAAATASAALPAQAAEQPGTSPPEACAKNPYGGGPNTGITLPRYYRPTPSVANANTFFPGMEELGSDEMRISSSPSSSMPGKNVLAFATEGVGR